jgi:hypothetical protein
MVRSVEYTPRLDSVPPGRSTRRHASKVCCDAQRLDRDVHAAAAGEPQDLLHRDRPAAVHHVSAPIFFAISRRPAMRSTPMTVLAPLSFAPAVAHSPIGPCANTATTSPMRMPAFSAPLKPVDMMSGHISTCSSVSPSGPGQVHHGIGHQHVLRLAAVDGVAESPAAERPSSRGPCRRRPASTRRTGRHCSIRSG